MDQASVNLTTELARRTSSQVGKTRRLRRLFSPTSGKTLVVPVDDGLIFGPAAGLEQPIIKVSNILREEPNALLAFAGVLRSTPQIFAAVPTILNITASTIRSLHTRKVQVGSVEQALQLGAEAVAVHVNIGSKYEAEMLKTLGSASKDCESNGMPLVAIMYPRSEADGGDDNYEQLKETDPSAYTRLVAHAARVGVELGADLVKTKYTGSPDSFRHVVDACHPVPLIIAGGPMLPAEQMFRITQDVILAGGAGVSFGRNVFGRPEPRHFMAGLKAIIHEGMSVAAAIERYAGDSSADPGAAQDTHEPSIPKR